ncbi:hypothetical protein KKB64_00850 [Patescibacteria group bacterium]|nr:hypothetical protein [Patescibacteria group bacterium]MBU1472322.1 hypothetical protein [Patescibacteria group bacterium]MBU2460426.1 hypothetical protein [Patescibacteria group bacterium]MBU2544245.1 hypothetical protein [Patescibacteria group bacterium]
MQDDTQQGVVGTPGADTPTPSAPTGDVGGVQTPVQTPIQTPEPISTPPIVEPTPPTGGETPADSQQPTQT